MSRYDLHGVDGPDTVIYMEATTAQDITTEELPVIARCLSIDPRTDEVVDEIDFEWGNLTVTFIDGDCDEAAHDANVAAIIAEIEDFAQGGHLASRFVDVLVDGEVVN